MHGVQRAGAARDASGSHPTLARRGPKPSDAGSITLDDLNASNDE